jgi:phosphohistidine phosphatase
MKYLYLIRHAKSSWDNPNQTDFERTLNERGEKDAPMMARLLKSKNILPDLIISSPATRAFTTAEIFAAHLNYISDSIKSDARIYEASTKNLADVIHEVDDNFNTVFLFGHNPGISNFANMISNQHVPDFPTCAVAGFELNIDEWSKAERYCGKLILFEYPKKY